MARTQIYLGEAELELLERAERSTGASRSELIRRAVRSSYGELSAEQRIEKLHRSAGIWSDRHQTGAEYVDELRGDLDSRLRRMGL